VSDIHRRRIMKNVPEIKGSRMRCLTPEEMRGPPPINVHSVRGMSNQQILKACRRLLNNGDHVGLSLILQSDPKVVQICGSIIDGTSRVRVRKN